MRHPSSNFTVKMTSLEVLGMFFYAFLLLGFAFQGLCDENSMFSIPLGFEISGFERNGILVSKNGVFEFGFLDNLNDGFVVGIRYKLGKTKFSNVPVWLIGGGIRVFENSTFRLCLDGKLVLVENPNNLIVWSSNTSNLGVQKASLLDNGNLVLMGSDEELIWESFNSPTSTLLPGQSLHYPQTLRPISSKSISSYYNLVIRPSGELGLVWESNVTYWRSHLSSTSLVKEARFDGNGVLGLFDDRNRSVWSKTSGDFGNPTRVLRHLRIDQDGNLRIYSWDDLMHTWRIGWQAVENQCNVFGSCGLYSLCGYNSSGPVCDCLESDPLNPDPGSFGCKKMVDLGNCKMGTSMLILKQTVLYGLYPPKDFDIMLSEHACKDFCSNDTTCIAITSKNDGSGLCTVKRTSFISGYRNPFVPAISYLKVCLVPQAVLARGANAHGSVNPLPPKVQSKNYFVGIGVIVLVSFSGFVIIEMVVFCFIYQRRKIKAKTRIPFGKDDQMNPHYSVLIRLSFEEIKELTSNFANRLGPSVFKGVLPNKMLVVAKVLSNVVASEKDFRLGISTLGGTHHRNLVPLKGFCFEPKHKFLLYEYVPNGSLDKWLFDKKREKNEGNWEKRLEIARGVARGVAYLHTECQKCIGHGNLILENVLLDENMVPKLTDFGFRSLLGNEKDASTSSETEPERDIYMFGEMLIQIVTREREILEGTLEGIEEWEGVDRMVRIAKWCMQNQPFLRPSIGEVLKVLEGTLSVDRPPNLVISHRPENEIIPIEFEE